MKMIRIIKCMIGLSAGLIFSFLIAQGNVADSSNSHSQIEGRLAFAAFRNGNWDIYSIRGNGTDLRRITTDSADDKDPSWSPDGNRMAFRSNRDGNWEIYVVSLEDNIPRRLTFDMSYDGAPTWSPDGEKIAFESYRNDDLDVFVMNADGSAPRNLTADCSMGDFDPTWSFDGTHLAFTSPRMDDNDLFIMDIDTLAVTQWTNSSMPEGNASWSHDGQFLAFVQDQPDRREIYLGRVSETTATGGRLWRLTWFSHADAPVWSPTDDYIAYISHQHTDQDMEYLLLQAVHGLREEADTKSLFSQPVVVLSDWEITGPLSWTASDSPFGEVVTDFVPVVEQAFSPGLVGATAKSGSGVASSSDHFEDLLDVEAPNARLNSKLVEPFQRVREDVKSQAGYDFLAELSDMWRGADARNEGSAYLSWHKAGRAFDTLFDYRDESNRPLLEVVREDIAGETFWRVFLKAALQDGSMGMPLKSHPWDLSGRARRKHPDDGGTWKPIPYGYYVDLSEIIRHGGWERISAVNRDDFSWKWHFLGIEYWHHQWRDGLTWYQAMESVYTLERLIDLYDWNELVRKRENPYYLFNNGIPIPATANEWRDLQG